MGGEKRPMSEAEYREWRDELVALQTPLVEFLEKYTDHPLFSHHNLFRGYRNNIVDACCLARARAFAWMDDHRAEDEAPETKLAKIRKIAG